MCYEKLLEELKAKETKYFKDHDEYTICKRELKDNIDTYGTIGFNATFSSSIGLMLGTFESSRKFELDEIKYINEKYNEIKKLKDKISDEVNRVIK
jgi:hypothetical protein